MNAPRASLLLIEDDPQIRRFLATALDAHGYAFESAATGEDGLKLAATRRPDVGG